MLGRLLDWLLGWLSGRSAARELGRVEQQNADMKGDMATVRRANEAAKKAEQEPFDDDQNDRDARR